MYVPVTNHYDHGSSASADLIDAVGTYGSGQAAVDSFKHDVGADAQGIVGGLFGRGVMSSLTDDGIHGSIARFNWNYNPMTAWFTRSISGGAVKLGRELSQDEANKLYGTDTLKFDRPINEVTAKYLNGVHRNEEAYQRLASFDPNTWSSFFMKQGLGFAASFTDPVQLALMALPPMRVAGLAQMGKAGAMKAIFPSAEQFIGKSLLQSAGMRFTQMGVSGALGGAALGGMEWGLATQEQRDYTLAEFAQSMIYGGLLAGIMHTGFGFVGDLGRPSSEFRPQGFKRYSPPEPGKPVVKPGESIYPDALDARGEMNRTIEERMAQKYDNTALQRVASQLSGTNIAQAIKSVTDFAKAVAKDPSVPREIRIEQVRAANKFFAELNEYHGQEVASPIREKIVDKVETSPLVDAEAPYSDPLYKHYGKMHVAVDAVADGLDAYRRLKHHEVQRVTTEHGKTVPKFLLPQDTANLISYGGDSNLALSINEHVVRAELKAARPLSYEERMAVLEEKNGSRIPDAEQKTVADEITRRIKEADQREITRNASERDALAASTDYAPEGGKAILEAKTPDEAVKVLETEAERAKQNAVDYEKSAPERRREQVKTRTAAWKDVKVVTHDTQADYAKATGDKTASFATIKGAYADGSVHVVLENIKTAQDLNEALFHEGFHVGFSRLMQGEDAELYRGMMEKFHDSLASEGRGGMLEKIAEDYGYDPVADKALIAEEAVAKMAETNPDSTMFSELIYSLKKLIAKVIPAAVRWSEKDMVNLIRESGNLLHEGGEASIEGVRYAMAKPGMKLREVGKDFVVDDVDPTLIDDRLPVDKSIAKAAEVIKEWPRRIDAADGSKIDMFPRKHSDQAHHLVWQHELNRYSPEKAAWLPNVPDTLKNAYLRLVDSDTGNRVFVRSYRGGEKHMVVVRPDGIVEDQKPFKGSLWTQFKDSGKNRRGAWSIDWVRPSDDVPRSSLETPTTTSSESSIPSSTQKPVKNGPGRLPSDPIPTSSASAISDSGRKTFQGEANPPASESQGSDIRHSMEVNPKEEPGQFALPGFEDDAKALDEAVLNAKTRDEKFAALQAKRAAYVNYLVKRQAEEALADLPPGLDGLHAFLVGTNRQLDGARDSVEARMNATGKFYIGQLAAKLDKEGLFEAFRTPEAAQSIARELWRLDQPEGLRDAHPRGEHPKFERIAQIIHEVRDYAVSQANRSGAFIGRVPGYIFRQSHDMFAVRKAGFEAWKESIYGKLDWQRIEAEQAVEGAKLDRDKFLRGAFEGISTGIHLQEAGASHASGRQLPASQAKRLSASRKLHFATADDFMEYNSHFGTRSLPVAVLDGISSLGRSTALMEKLGTNPEMMFERLLRDVKIRERGAPSKSFGGQLLDSATLHTESGLRQLFATVTGMDAIPENVTLARIAQGVRMVETTSKMGFSMLSSMPDLATATLDMKYQGMPALKGLQRLVTAFTENGDVNKSRVAMRLGILTDTLLEDMMAGVDSPQTGGLTRMKVATNWFFRLNGQEFWDKSIRRGMARGMAEELGQKSSVGFSALEPETQRLLKMYNIDAPHWEAMRKTAGMADDGQTYLLPEHVLNMDKAELSKLKALEGYKKSAESYQHDLMTRLMTFYTDRLGYGITTPGALERSMMGMGTRPGTLTGEAARFAWQLKGFILTHTNRVLGRELLGRRGWMEKMAGLTTLAATTTALAYISLQLRQVAQGKTPLPNNYQTYLNALASSGGMGIMGDLIFRNYDPNRNPFLDFVGGPAVGDAGALANRPFAAFGGDKEMRGVTPGDIKTYIRMIPGNNLLPIKAAIDYGVIYRLQEMVEPGYLERMEKRMKAKTGQEYFIPPSRVSK